MDSRKLNGGICRVGAVGRYEAREEMRDVGEQQTEGKASIIHVSYSNVPGWESRISDMDVRVAGLWSVIIRAFLELCLKGLKDMVCRQ